MAAPLSYANLNALWASFLVECLAVMGLRRAVVSPGSRSALLTWALARNERIEAIPVLDERSAGFYALGMARRSGTPVVLVATSGTAGANFYPAVIEASEDGVPLLVLTADRPPEMRDCRAGQTVEQRNLFGRFVRWESELLLPEADRARFRYLRQTLRHAWEIGRGPLPGPVHLNIPFREPLAPTEDPGFCERAEGMCYQDLLPDSFESARSRVSVSGAAGDAWFARWRKADRGIIVAGPAQPDDDAGYAEAVGKLAGCLGWPVLTDGLSPVRNHLDKVPQQISRYEFILREPGLAEALRPEAVIRLGPLPTSKTLRAWLEAGDPETCLVTSADRNLDPLHGRTTHLRCEVEDLVSGDVEGREVLPYGRRWQDAEGGVARWLAAALSGECALFEGKIAWLLSRHLPHGTPCFFAASMPVRDVEFFWEPGTRRLRPYCNRGVNGIDGTLSTALGVCRGGEPGVLLTGDLAFLHDANGLLQLPGYRGGLTVFLVNNHGGGIFEKLPIAAFDPPFEEYFATPQAVDFGHLARAHGAEYRRVESWSELLPLLKKLPAEGVRIVEIPTDRKADVLRRERLFKEGANVLRADEKMP